MGLVSSTSRFPATGSQDPSPLDGKFRIIATPAPSPLAVLRCNAEQSCGSSVLPTAEASIQVYLLSLGARTARRRYTVIFRLQNSMPVENHWTLELMLPQSFSSVYSQLSARVLRQTRVV